MWPDALYTDDIDAGNDYIGSQIALAELTIGQISQKWQALQ